jgi:hypothetical protein
VLRAVMAISGICVIIWSIGVVFVFRTDALYTENTRAILSGEVFSSEQLRTMKARLDASPSNLLLPSALTGAVVLRLLLVENELKTGDPASHLADLGQLELSTRLALGQSPTEPLMWLVAFWLKRELGKFSETDLALLNMSYRTGPNEGWLAVRRNWLSLSVFGSLSPELAQQAIREFAGLVGSDFYTEAADILAGPGWAVREKLLERLVDIPEGNRRRFARVLVSKNLGGLRVPGVEQAPARPF